MTSPTMARLSFIECGVESKPPALRTVKLLEKVHDQRDIAKESP